MRRGMLHTEYDKLVKEIDSSLAKIRACRLCDFHNIVHKKVGNGRGYGLREGNRARGAMIQHLKSAHPEQYAQAMVNSKITAGGHISC